MFFLGRCSLAKCRFLTTWITQLGTAPIAKPKGWRLDLPPIPALIARILAKSAQHFANGHAGLIIL